MRSCLIILCYLLSFSLLNSSCNSKNANENANYAVSCGHLNKLQITPKERQAGRINVMDHTRDLVSREGGLVAFATEGHGS